MSPRPDVSEERKNQILDAAMNVFARLGFHKARLDDIVAESGLSKGALYWYYKSKDAIIIALLERIFAGSMKDVQALVNAEGSVSERLMLLIRHAAAEIKQMTNILPVAYEFYAVAMRQKVVRQYLKEYYLQYRAPLAALIRQGVERGEFRQVDPEETAITITALIEGTTLLWMVDPQVTNWETQYTAGMRLLLEGLQART